VREPDILLEQTRETAKIADDIPPEQVFDNRFVKQVEKELKGWIPQIPK